MLTEEFIKIIDEGQRHLINQQKIINDFCRKTIIFTLKELRQRKGITELNIMGWGGFCSVMMDDEWAETPVFGIRLSGTADEDIKIEMTACFIKSEDGDCVKNVPDWREPFDENGNYVKCDWLSLMTATVEATKQIFK